MPSDPPFINHCAMKKLKYVPICIFPLVVLTSLAGNIFDFGGKYRIDICAASVYNKSDD